MRKCRREGATSSIVRGKICASRKISHSEINPTTGDKIAIIGARYVESERINMHTSLKCGVKSYVH